MLMVMSTKVIGKMIKLMEKEFILIKMELSMMVTGLKINNMDKV
jgi:hypothetical protein